MPTMFQDLRYAIRQLLKAPGFAATAILTLALGIAANVVVFGIVHALVLRPLPFPHPEQIYQVQHRATAAITFSYPQYRDLRDRNDTFSDLAEYRIARVGLGVDGVAKPGWGMEVTGNFFRLLGAKPLLGRLLIPEDDAYRGASFHAVLSYGAWRDRFAADPQIIGRTVLLNKLPYTVVGVTQPGFQGIEQFLSPEVWLPMSDAAQIEGYNWLENRNDNNALMIGRLKHGVTREQAAADLNRVSAQLAKEHPATDEHLDIRLSRSGFFGDALGAPMRGFLSGVMILALLVLFTACVNIGSLFAARTSDRTREISVRIAIGASRWRIFRQLLSESLAVAVLGGTAGCILASSLLRGLSQYRPPVDFPVQVSIRPDAQVFVFACATSALTGLLVALVTVRQIWNSSPNQAMRSSLEISPAVRRLSLRDLLLAVQITLCSVLITASFVSLRGLDRTLHADLGFDPRNVTLATFELQLAGYKLDEAQRLQRELLDRASHLPGVTAVGFANTVPLALDQSSTGVFPAGSIMGPGVHAQFDAQSFSVSPGYFHAAGTQLLAGRDFTWHDDKHAPRMAIVNRTFAQTLFGTDQAIGKRFGEGDKDTYEVVGIVEDGKYGTVTEDPTPALFYPTAQQPNTSTVLLVRTDSSSDAAETASALQKLITWFDPGIPISSIAPWQSELAIALFPARAATIALGFLGAFALLLAVTGIFGLASYTVSKRLREFGIRIALGASSRQVLRAAFRRTAMLLAGSSLAGLALGAAASKLLASIVYGASSHDPWVLVGAVVTMALVGLLASVVPARRALSADPALLLRSE